MPVAYRACIIDEPKPRRSGPSAPHTPRRAVRGRQLVAAHNALAPARVRHTSLSPTTTTTTTTMLSALSRTRTTRLPSAAAARTVSLNLWSRIRALSLAGTVPAHDACILLHTHQPPAEYPARSRSPLWRALTLKGREWGCVVNFAWAPAQAVHGAYAGLGEEFGSGSAHGRGLGDAQEEGEGGEKGEAYVASVFVRGHRGRVEIPEVTLKNVDEIAATIQQRITMTPMTLRAGAAGVATQQPEHIIHREGHTHRKEHAEEQAETEADADRLYLYVCTHGSRDCRCGDAGGDVVRALRAEVARRGIADEVFVGEVAHVGGHK